MREFFFLLLVRALLAQTSLPFSYIIDFLLLRLFFTRAHELTTNDDFDKTKGRREMRVEIGDQTTRGALNVFFSFFYSDLRDNCDFFPCLFSLERFFQRGGGRHDRRSAIS